MDEAEKYQQRLQAIVFSWLLRDNLQEDSSEVRGEASAAGRRGEADEGDRGRVVEDNPGKGDLSDSVREQTKSQKTPEDEEAADARKEEQASQEENKEESVKCAAAARTHCHYQAGTDEDVQVNKKAKHHFSAQMAQRMFHDGGQEGRSVLGSLAVQVERDPKTGATVVRSVAPVSTPAGVPTATSVFDDGRKSIHAVGGSGSQPSSEELGQILSFVDGVGMKVLLDEVTVTPNKAEAKKEKAKRAPEGKVLSFSTRSAMSKEDNAQSDSSRGYSSRGYNAKAKLGTDDRPIRMGNKKDEKEDRSVMAVKDRSVMAVKDIAGEVGNVEDLKLDEGPVTLMFMGYADADQDDGQDDSQEQGMLTVERVIITEDGDVLGPETSASPQAGKESKVFQDIALDGNGAGGVKVQEEEDDKGLHESSSPIKAEGDITSKRKTCKCCSVM
ncbi:uncharacterized protein LOC141781447 [Sebastes fasciatus]|uniref:uncharacterized protein LOC141781447 n=1 Tax=Sebastes fasciatus TaxID=394691 RepID=UPI003D9F86C4